MLEVFKSLPLIHGLILVGALLFLMQQRRHPNANVRKWKVWQVAALLGLTTFVLGMAYTSSGHGWGDDFAEYIAQANALENGNVRDWMKHNTFIIENSQYGMGATVYPWGMAFLLAPLVKLFGLNFTVFKIFESLCLAGSVVCLVYFYRRRFELKETVVLTLFTAWNPWVLKWADDVTAHVPCMFVILATFLILDGYVKENHRTWLRALVIGGMVFFSIQLRTISLGVLLALFFVDLKYLFGLIRKHRELSVKQWLREVGTGVTPYVLFLAGTVAMKVLMPQAGGTYQSYFDFSPTVILNNLKNYTEIFGLFFCDVVRPSPDGGIFFRLCSMALWLFGLCGMVLKHREELYYVLYTLVTMMVLLVFTGSQLTLYVLAVFPIILMFAWIGAKQLLHGVSLKGLKALSAGMLSAMCLWNLYSIWNIQSGRNGINTAYSKEAVELYDYINDEISDDEVIYFFKPRALYLNTGNYAYWCDPEEEQWEKASYLILYPYDPEYDSVRSYVENGMYSLQFENRSFQLYRKDTD